MKKITESYYIGINVELGKNVVIGYGSFIDDNVKIENDVIIGRHSILYTDSYIAEGTNIGSNCIIGHPTKLQLQQNDFSAYSPKVIDYIVKDNKTIIGRDSIVRSGSVIYRHVILGRKLRTGHNVLIREHTKIGNNCVVGTNAVLDGYIKIGDLSMIQSNCYLCQTVSVGKGVFISPGCVFMDNKQIILGNGLNGAKIGDYVRIGGGSKILPSIKIGDYCLIGAGSIVTKDLPEKSVAWGNPVHIIRKLDEDEVQTYIRSIENWV